MRGHAYHLIQHHDSGDHLDRCGETTPQVHVILQESVDQFHRLSLIELLLNGQEHRKAGYHDEQVNHRCQYDQPCGYRWMVKPDQQDIDLRK